MNIEEIVIRPVQDEDFPAITEIYNYYVLKGEQSFETEAVTAEEMQQRAFIITIDSHYLVAVSGGTILGFCYAHKWKERAAYSNTLETTIYLSKDARHRGVGKLLMERLIESCRQDGYRWIQTLRPVCQTGGDPPSGRAGTPAPPAPVGNHSSSSGSRRLALREFFLSFLVSLPVWFSGSIVA